jgi:hypothetical protein
VVTDVFLILVLHSKEEPDYYLITLDLLGEISFGFLYVSSANSFEIFYGK